jgi:pilus assembly protein Flp/PilA
VLLEAPRQGQEGIKVSVISALIRFIRHTGAVTAIEYAFIASLISIAIYAAASTIGTHLSTVFSTVASSF